ncbi:hypothetical protein PNBC_03985 [Paenibacillus crassostreae]|uniref:DinB-like domain-containing protein n=2 Tax=Paenibacillus crassostreae TaxID=1763538 RepID=A0A167FHR2_9BACL|nr:hypothetical protein LPB68_20755 [Paenibacillus crassostreae]OAB76571.1 hypothetical protein PNBC_03985 [Paenibacillus crassostreae]
MLVKNLGQTRLMLLDSIKELTDKQLNQKQSSEKWSISQVLFHLYTTEKEIALLIFNSLNSGSKKIAERDLSILVENSVKNMTTNEPPEEYITKNELIGLLEESRFQYVQAIFNEVHAHVLLEKSVEHPEFGWISSQDLLEFIWHHEKGYIKQIEEIKQGLN